MNNQILRNFNVRVEGQGNNCIVFGHSIGTDLSIWSRVLQLIELDTLRVIRYDLICSGAVNPDLYNPERYSTIDAYVDDLIDILDVLNVEQCTFIGHAASAMIGILASIRQPDRFPKLILLGASARYINDNNYHGGIELEDSLSLHEVLHRNYAFWCHGLAATLIPADLPEAIQEFSRTLFNMRPDISLHAVEMIIRTDIRSVLHQVRARCYIIQTARDPSVPMTAAEYLAHNLGGLSSLITLRAEGHLPHLSAPGLVGPLIRRLIFNG